MTDSENGATLSDRFERFLAGVPRFVGRLLATPWFLVRDPERFAREVIVEGKRPYGSLPPFTFLFACAALASIVIKAYVAAQLDFTQLFLQLSQVFAGLGALEIFAIALPVAIAVLICCLVTDWFLIQDSQGRYQRAALLSYAPAVVLLAAFVAHLTLALFNFWVGARVPEDYTEVQALQYRYLRMGLTGGLLLLGFLVSSRAARGVLSVARPRWRLAISYAFVALLILTVIATGYSGLRVRYALLYANAPRYSGPVVEVVEHRFEPVGNGDVDVHFKLLIQNRITYDWTLVDRGPDSPMRGHPMDERLSANWPQLAWGRDSPIGLRIDRMALVGSPAGDSPFVVVPAWGRSWMQLNATFNEQSMRALRGFARDPEGVVILVLPFVTGAKPGEALGHIPVDVAWVFAKDR
jgi:hypothetical protein